MRSRTGASMNPDLAALATAYVLLMAILGPVAARFVEPIAMKLRRTRPRPVDAI